MRARPAGLSGEPGRRDARRPARASSIARRAGRAWIDGALELADGAAVPAHSLTRTRRSMRESTELAYVLHGIINKAIINAIALALKI